MEGRPNDPSQESYRTDVRRIGEGYFGAMGIPLIRGRDVGRRDTAEAPQIAVINQAASDLYWPNEDPMGERISMGGPYRTIVGVVGNVRHWGLDRGFQPEVYVPLFQRTDRDLTFVVRSASDSTVLASVLRRQISAVDPELPILEIQTMERILSESVWRPRFSMFLFGMFAALALILGTIGTYTVVANSLAQRTHEMGIRSALGASRLDLLVLAVGQGIGYALAGTGAGIILSLLLGRFLSGILFEVSPADPVTIGTVALFLLLVASVACYVPARRAANADPLVALRHE